MNVDYLRDGLNEGHWHAVVSGKPNATIADDHQEWHDTGAPCLFCGRIRWTVGTHHLTLSGLPLKPCVGGER